MGVDIHIVRYRHHTIMRVASFTAVARRTQSPLRLPTGIIWIYATQRDFCSLFDHKRTFGRTCFVRYRAVANIGVCHDSPLPTESGIVAQA